LTCAADARSGCTPSEEWRRPSCWPSPPSCCSSEGAILTDARLDGADLTDAQLIEANLTNATLYVQHRHSVRRMTVEQILAADSLRGARLSPEIARHPQVAARVWAEASEQDSGATEDTADSDGEASHDPS
jgi:pentapeptide repeat protein